MDEMTDVDVILRDPFGVVWSHHTIQLSKEMTEFLEGKKRAIPFLFPGTSNHALPCWIEFVPL